MNLLLLPPGELLSQLNRESYQGSGAGGQKRNRVLSGIRLRLPRTDLVSESCEHRESQRNLMWALHRLRISLALHLSRVVEPDEEFLKDLQKALPPFRMPINPDHSDLPGQILLLLLALRIYLGDHGAVARVLGVTPTSLLRFTALNGRTREEFQKIRRENSLPELKLNR